MVCNFAFRTDNGGYPPSKSLPSLETFRRSYFGPIQKNHRADVVVGAAGYRPGSEPVYYRSAFLSPEKALSATPFNTVNINYRSNHDSPIR